MAKVAVDSLSRAQASNGARGTRRRQRQSAQRIAANKRDAEPTSVVVLRECYRLAVDSTDWRGVCRLALRSISRLPAFARRVRWPVRALAGGAGPGAAPKAVAQPANSPLQLSPRRRESQSGLRVASNGRLDSNVIGSWFAVRADTIGVRLASADPSKAITVLLTGGELECASDLERPHRQRARRQNAVRALGRSYLRSIRPMRLLPLSAIQSRWRVESKLMLRTIVPLVGIGTTSMRSVAGSNRTIVP